MTLPIDNGAEPSALENVLENVPSCLTCDRWGREVWIGRASTVGFTETGQGMSSYVCEGCRQRRGQYVLKVTGSVEFVPMFGYVEPTTRNEMDVLADLAFGPIPGQLDIFGNEVTS